jgi:hypothetical protein
MFCSQCGAAPTPGGRFCGNCGTLLPFAPLAAVTVGGPLAPDAAPAPSRQPDASRRSSLAFTLAVVACIVACGVVFTAVTSLLRGYAAPADARTGTPRDRDSVRAEPQGPMGALLAPARRNERADTSKLR